MNLTWYNNDVILFIFFFSPFVIDSVYRNDRYIWIKFCSKKAGQVKMKKYIYVYEDPSNIIFQRVQSYRVLRTTWVIHQAVYLSNHWRERHGTYGRSFSPRIILSTTDSVWKREKVVHCILAYVWRTRLKENKTKKKEKEKKEFERTINLKHLLFFSIVKRSQ